ncbi:Chloroperoxidase [Mycena rosella]|uniref:Chloroperoxidase n=1 Tax=Mycena rosella TaxID=1033263 RepID=A0AAD7CHG7_MYCRO|nr:Chloroperoxidase [Mycena rosella]
MTTMKPTTLFLSFLSISLAYAFPSFDQIQPKTPALPTLLAPRRIDVSGKHAFVPPSADDMRGPCPAMNALANHNYLPHSGYITVEEGTTIPNLVWGFGVDFTELAILLAQVYGSGDGVHFSIGGPPPPSLVPASLFDGQGLSGTHNTFEADSSPTRGDYYAFNGNNHDLQKPFFKSLLAANNNSNGLISGGIIDHRIERYDNSVATNPYFFFGPDSMVISTLTHLFVTNVLPNFDPAHPDGYLSDEDLYTLYGFSIDNDGNLQYNTGHERIPEGWYRRPVDYTHVQAASQIIALGKAAQRTLTPGGNMGEVNSFTPMDMAKLTDGAYTDKTLFEGNNTICFCFQVLQLAMPSQVLASAAFVAGGDTDLLQKWGCPQMKKLNEEMYNKYPGYKKRY